MNQPSPPLGTFRSFRHSCIWFGIGLNFWSDLETQTKALTLDTNLLWERQRFHCGSTCTESVNYFAFGFCEMNKVLSCRRRTLSPKLWTVVIKGAGLWSRFEHGSSIHCLKQIKSILCRLGKKWQRRAVEIHKEHVVDPLRHWSDFSRMLTVQPKMSADGNDLPWEPLSKVTDTEEKPSAIRQV